ncbi:hypothetical protein HDU96_000311 [Phlyctochytrium bullatum]|nr:hypothetical protein HDU96_000311 [Phlyctochytrium bullatum]
MPASIYLIYLPPLLHTLALILIISATATPNWYLFDALGIKTDQGFYATRICLGGVCLTTSGAGYYNGFCEGMKKAGDNCRLFDTIRALLVITSILGFLGLGLFTLSHLHRGHKATRVWVLTGMAASFVHTLLAFVVMCLAVQFRGTAYIRDWEAKGAPVGLGGSFVMVVLAWIFGAGATAGVPFTVAAMTA